MSESLTQLSLPPMNLFLLLGGLLSLIAAGFHILCILGGPDWLRFFGAGERLARMAESGSTWPGIVTGMVCIALVIVGTYAMVAATASTQTALPLPFLKWIVLAITAIYLIRGIYPLAAMGFVEAFRTPFAIWSSIIVLAYGIIHAIGLLQVWTKL